MTAAVFQLSVVRTILFFVMLVLWTDEKYDYGDVDFLNPNSYVNIIIGASTFLSFYGYLLFYKATKSSLQGYGLQGKFVCITVVLVLFGLQSGILETMGALGAIPCLPPFSINMRSQIIFHYAVIVEMFFTGLLARYSFRKLEPGGEAPRLAVHRSVQTDAGGNGGAAGPRPRGGLEPEELSLGPGPDADEALCRIEHAPLDRFDFAAGRGTLAAFAPDSAPVGMNALQVRAQINCGAPGKDVTVV
uniref:organic solute transporter subunit alpha n=1 Tax=Pristiophorus japonicus TaxID=55135 RepID=UPI00398E5C6B